MPFYNLREEGVGEEKGNVSSLVVRKDGSKSPAGASLLKNGFFRVVFSVYSGVGLEAKVPRVDAPDKCRAFGSRN